jgi:hypothetical protein
MRRRPFSRTDKVGVAIIVAFVFIVLSVVSSRVWWDGGKPPPPPLLKAHTILLLDKTDPYSPDQVKDLEVVLTSIKDLLGPVKK